LIEREWKQAQQKRRDADESEYAALKAAREAERSSERRAIQEELDAEFEKAKESWQLGDEKQEIAAHKDLTLQG
jgi:hypothetical protein